MRITVKWLELDRVFDNVTSPADIGLSYISNSIDPSTDYDVLYKIVDEKLFFLAAIKYGIRFEKRNENY